MRNDARIPECGNRLAQAWLRLPDWRFGQLICNCLGEMASTGRDPFFPEEDEMIRFIEKYCAEHSPYFEKCDTDGASLSDTTEV